MFEESKKKLNERLTNHVFELIVISYKFICLKKTLSRKLIAYFY